MKDILFKIKPKINKRLVLRNMILKYTEPKSYKLELLGKLIV